MKSKKNKTSKQKLCYLINKSCTPLIFLSLLITSGKTYSVVPDSATVTEIQPGNGPSRINIQDNDKEKEGRPARIGDKLLKLKNKLTVVASTSNQSIFANLVLRKDKYADTTIHAIAQNGSSTTYSIPCEIELKPPSKTTIAWSDGKKSVCQEGVTISNRSSNRFSMLKKINNISPICSEEMTLGKNGSEILDKNQSFLESQAIDNLASHERDLRYYCSSVPNYGDNGGKIVIGKSIDEVCEKSQRICENSNSQGCSIATMGEWNINDPILKISRSCTDGTLNSKRVSGSEVTLHENNFENFIENLLEESLGEVGSKIANIINPKSENTACYIHIYRPDEVIISPIVDGETIVLTTGLDNGQIQIDVMKGKVNILSTNNQIDATEGETYIFSEEGSVFRSERPTYPTEPTDSTYPPNPTYPTEPAPTNDADPPVIVR